MFRKTLEEEQKRIDKKLKFIEDPDHDLFDYLESLHMENKTENRNVIFQDKYRLLQQYPCITKVVSFTDPDTAFPKFKTRNPFECAKIQHLLCMNYPSPQATESVQKKIETFKCDCKDCYLLALHAVYDGNKIKL